MARPDAEGYNTLKWLLERLTRSEDYCRPYFDRAKRYYRLYRFASAVDDKDWPYVNRVRSRDVMAFVEDSTALLIQTLFAAMPFFAVIPRETRVLRQMQDQIDPMRMADQISRALDYQISHEDTEFFEEIVDFFKGGTIFGNSYIGVYPKFTEDGRYLRPLLKATDFWDVMPIRGARRVSKARGMFVREFATTEDLRKLQERGIYADTDQIRTIGSSGTDPDKDWHGQLLQEVGMEDYAPDKSDIEVLHYFSGGHVITFGDRKVILRDSNSGAKPYPYDNPIVQYKYMPVPLEFFSMGIPEVLEVLAEDKNLIRSARRDNIDLVINKILKARSGADINFDLIKYYAGAIWPLENLNDIEEMDMQDVTQSSYQEEGLVKADMENALSLFGYARGMTPQHSEQPTTVMKLQQASLNRMDLAVKLAEFGPLQNIATRIILLTRQFMAQEDYESIIGDTDAGFYKLSLEDVRRFFYFKPVGSSVTNIKEVRQAQIQFAMNALLQVPPEVSMNSVEPFAVNWYEALKIAMDSADVPNVDRILIKEEEAQPPPQEPGMPNENNLQDLAGIMYGGGEGENAFGS